jgi:hypothetical protein
MAGDKRMQAFIDSAVKKESDEIYGEED